MVLLDGKMAFSCGVEVADEREEVRDALVENGHLEIFQADEEGMDHHPEVYQGGVGGIVHLLEVYPDDLVGNDSLLGVCLGDEVGTCCHPVV